MYILAPVPNNVSGIDWEKNEQAFRDLVLDIVEEKAGLKDVRKYIQVEKIISPKTWESDFNIYEGRLSTSDTSSHK